MLKLKQALVICPRKFINYFLGIFTRLGTLEDTRQCRDIRTHVEWARAHVDKPVEYQRFVLFRDDYPFVLQLFCKKCVWRGRNERNEC